MEELLSFAISGVYSLLILSLTFNFLLAVRLHQTERQIEGVEECSKADFKRIAKRLEVLNEIREP